MHKVAGRFQRIKLQEIRDVRGLLTVVEEGSHVPFPVKRLFVIQDVPAGGNRGGHAHRAQHQFLFMLSGSCRMIIDDGTTRWEERMDHDGEGLHIPPGLWLELVDFTADAICVVLASGLYEEADYIRDRAEFRGAIG